MEKDIIFEEINAVPFSPILREDILTAFKENCKDGYNDFLKLFFLTREIDAFLSTKINTNDNSSKE